MCHILFYKKEAVEIEVVAVHLVWQMPQTKFLS